MLSLYGKLVTIYSLSCLEGEEPQCWEGKEGDGFVVVAVVWLSWNSFFYVLHTNLHTYIFCRVFL